jgi:hypothetical protein
VQQTLQLTSYENFGAIPKHKSNKADEEGRAVRESFAKLVGGLSVESFHAA